LGSVSFSALDGDVVFAYFDIVSDTCGGTCTLTPFSFDPGVRGQTEGSFTFYNRCISDFSFSWTTAVTLVDALGLVSDPFLYTVTCVPVSTAFSAEAAPTTTSEPLMPAGGGGPE
jgi:hypothetical protein